MNSNRPSVALRSGDRRGSTLSGPSRISFQAVTNSPVVRYWWPAMMNRTAIARCDGRCLVIQRLPVTGFNPP